MTLQVVTANALIEGDVVYLGAQGAWVRTLSGAQVFSDAESAEAALQAASARTGEVVGVYLMPVALKNGAPQTTHFREAFRRTGPSNRFHGKQADLKENRHVSL